MIAPTAHLAVHVRRDQTVNDRRAEQHMVDTKARVPRPCASEIVPKSIDAFARMKGPHRIGPALRDQAMERPADLGPKQRIIDPALRLINIEFGGHHIEIAGQARYTGRQELCGVRRQPFELA